MNRTNQPKLIISILFLCSILLLPACSKIVTKASNQKGFQKFEKIDEGSLKIPEFPYQTWTLDNGLKVFFVHDPELPLVSSTLFIRAGSFWESENEKGLYDALGYNMRSGGAGNLDPQALDLENEKYAASISSDFNQEFGTVSASSLSTDFEKIFALMCDVLLRPAFDRQRLSLWKGQSLEGIKRRVDDPTTVATLSMRELLVGGSSFGTITRTEDIIAITRAKLRTLHQKVVSPNNAILAVSGNISKEQAEKIINKYLGKWGKSPQTLPPLPSYPAQKNSGIIFIEQTLPQASILIGQFGPERFTKDQYAIEVFNQYFGSGGFGSLLMKRIRTELGLAYGVYGVVQPGLGKGRSLIHIQTKPEPSGEAILESIKSLERMRVEPISPDELNETKKGIINTFIFNFTSPAQVISRNVQFELIGYPKNYDQEYLNNIRSVGSKDLMEIANSRWNFNDFVIVLVGPQSALQSLVAIQTKLPAPLHSANIKLARFDEILKLEKQ